MTERIELILSPASHLRGAPNWPMATGSRLQTMKAAWVRAQRQIRSGSVYEAEHSSLSTQQVCPDVKGGEKLCGIFSMTGHLVGLGPGGRQNWFLRPAGLTVVRSTPELSYSYHQPESHHKCYIVHLGWAQASRAQIIRTKISREINQYF